MLFIIHLYWYLFDMHVPVSFHFLCIASLGISATGNMNMNTVSCPNCSVGLASIPLLTPMFGFFYFCLHCHRLQGPNEKKREPKELFYPVYDNESHWVDILRAKRKKEMVWILCSTETNKKKCSIPSFMFLFSSIFPLHTVVCKSLGTNVKMIVGFVIFLGGKKIKY